MRFERVTTLFGDVELFGVARVVDRHGAWRTAETEGHNSVATEAIFWAIISDAARNALKRESVPAAQPVGKP